MSLGFRIWDLGLGVYGLESASELPRMMTAGS